jgi:hypothetical protein
LSIPSVTDCHDKSSKIVCVPPNSFFDARSPSGNIGLQREEYQMVTTYRQSPGLSFFCRGPLSLAVLTLAGLLAMPTQTAAARDLQGTRAAAMGGALRAQAIGNSAVYLNPAGMSLGNMYVVTGLYQFRGSDSASQISAAVVDSQTSKRIAAGLYYNFIRSNPTFSIASQNGAVQIDQTDTTHEVGLALSMPLGRYIMLGVTQKYINHGSDLPASAPEDLPKADISAYTVDVGGIVRVGRFNFAAVGYNLVPVDDEFTNLYPQSLGLGVSVAFGTLFSAGFDTVLDFTSDPDNKVKPSFHGGGELFLAKRYALRVGAMHDTVRDATYVTGGGGLVFKRLSFEASVRQMVNGGDETLVALSLNLFLR